MQQEVKLDRSTQNLLLQKLSNLASTGDDSTSYKKAMEKINKKQIEEIGTTRSQGRPINVIKEEKFKIQDEIGELEGYKIRKQEIEKEKEQQQEEIRNLEDKLKLIYKLKEVSEKSKFEEEKIKIGENLKQNQEQKKNELQKQKNILSEKIKTEENNLKKEKLKSLPKLEKQSSKTKLKKVIAIILAVITTIITIASIFLVKNFVIPIVVGFISIILFIWFIIESKKSAKIKLKENEQMKIEEENDIKQKEIEQQKIEQNKLQTEINILEKNIEEQEKSLQESKQKVRKQQELEIEKIKQKFPEINIEKISNIEYELHKNEEEKNNKKVQYNSLEIEEKSIMPKLERASAIEEELEDIKQREKDLEQENQAIELAKEMLEIAYEKMKKNITPKLTEELSNNIKKISDGKYSKISLHEQEGIIIEKENGEYVEAEKLSTGTIDQLYLSLRLAMAKELSKESMPIILDEAFAYYDDKRLSNILNYINEEYKENQIIILTCTNREKEIMDKLNIKYNLIEM